MLLHVRDGRGQQIVAVAIIVKANKDQNSVCFLANGGVTFLGEASSSSHEPSMTVPNSVTLYGSVLSSIRPMTSARSPLSDRPRARGMTVNSISMLHPRTARFNIQLEIAFFQM